MKMLCKMLRSIFRIHDKITKWLRARYYANIFAACGRKKYPWIASTVIFSSPENISCGNDLRLNPQVYLIGRGGIEFGNNVIVSAGAKILSSTLNLTEGKITRRHVHKKVTIGNDVWIGLNAVIMDGVTIGDGAVVGTNAVVTRDVPPYAIVVGLPAKVLRYRFDENTIARLQKSRWFDRDIEFIKQLPMGDIEKCLEILEAADNKK